MKRRIIVISLILVIAAVATVSILKGRAKKVMQVETVLVEAADLSREISSNGEIGSKRHATVVSTASGAVTLVPVQVGDRVEAGAVIARIDPAGLESSRSRTETALENARMTVQAELLAGRAAYSQALSARDQADRDLARTQELNRKGSASADALQRARDTAAAASDSLLLARRKLNLREGRPLDDPQSEAPPSDESIVESSLEVRQAAANVESADRSLEDTVLRATIGGTITALAVEQGGFVAAGAIAAEIHDTRSLEITANIDEVDLPYVRIGQKVKVESDSFIGTVLEAEVSRIAPVIRKVGDSRVCEIKADILADEEGKARVGASCSIFITVEEKKGAPAIPVESYLAKDGKKYAFRLVTDAQGKTTVSKGEIEIGLTGIEKVEILSGLALGDEIVKANLGVLEDGMEARRAAAKERGGGSP